MAVVIVILIILLILYFYSKSHSFSMWENIKQSTNFFLLKLIVFFFIIGSLTKIVSVTTEVGFLSFISTGSYVLAGIFFVIMLFRIFFVHDSDCQLLHFDLSNIGKWHIALRCVLLYSPKSSPPESCTKKILKSNMAVLQ